MKKPAQLTTLYYQSVGRGATLLLNVPPNRDGLLSPEDVASLQGFGAYLNDDLYAESRGARQDAMPPTSALTTSSSAPRTCWMAAPTRFGPPTTTSPAPT